MPNELEGAGWFTGDNGRYLSAKLNVMALV